MEREGAERALARIRAAADRIEAAAARARQARQKGGDAGLEVRHARLRGTVAASLKELDALIGTLEK